jgi:hypothetical protein
LVALLVPYQPVEWPALQAVQLAVWIALAAFAVSTLARSGRDRSALMLPG